MKLSDRVEALTGPDREILKQIFSAVYPERVPSPIVQSGYGWREDVGGWWLATGEDARTTPKSVYPPNWLGSLDAAMTLVDSVWTDIEVEDMLANGFTNCRHKPADIRKDLARFVTAACLRARGL